jgi:hypothetical protein
MKIRDFRREFVYHSPQFPGYTCWTGLYKMPDDAIMCSFTQATGPFAGRPKAPESVRRFLDWPPPPGSLGEFANIGESYDMTGLDFQNVHLLSRDFAKTWEFVEGDHFKTCLNGVTGQCEAALSDGSILRGVEGQYLPYDDVPQTGFTQRSLDGSRTWGTPEVIYPEDGFMFVPKRLRILRDGRLLVGGGLVRIHPEDNHRDGWFNDITGALFVSEDNGKSWNGPIDLVPCHQNKRALGLTEEFDWVELSSGDLLVILRADNHPNGPSRLQTRMTSDGKTWKTTQIGMAPFPHSGHPEMLMTTEGIAFHISTEAISWTDDEGRTWHGADTEDQAPSWIPPAWYYPRAVQMANGEIFIVGHVGGDNGYGQVDQSIVASRFFVEL